MTFDDIEATLRQRLEALPPARLAPNSSTSFDSPTSNASSSYSPLAGIPGQGALLLGSSISFPFES
jgi:hypothetical protein